MDQGPITAMLSSIGTTELLCGTMSLLVVLELFTPANPISLSLRLLKHFRSQEKGLTSSNNVKSGIDEYNRLHSSTAADERNKEYKSLVNSYYDLATLFYEWGWGQSFHFANRYPNESFQESIKRHEYYLASKLNLSKPMSKIQTATTAVKSGSTSKTESNSSSNPTLKVLDVGCGIGGPMRNICKFTGVDVTGLTLNQYQVNRGNELCQMDPQLGLNGRPRCRSVQGDFMEMPFEGNTYDAAYAIEATCHAPDRVGVYSEIYRVLKPGSIFACYEWCMTDNFDPKNEDHLRMKKEIEEGDGLPDICHTSVCLEAMKKAGFEIIDEKDIAEEDYGAGYGGKPWMLPLLPSWNPMTQRFQFNWFGKALTKYVLKGMEFIRLAPKGTSQTQIMLQKGGSGLGDAGNAKIFTPMYLMVGRVPMEKKKM